jgi:hypothetical protein
MQSTGDLSVLFQTVRSGSSHFLSSHFEIEFFLIALHFFMVHDDDTTPKARLIVECVYARFEHW